MGLLHEMQEKGRIHTELFNHIGSIEEIVPETLENWKNPGYYGD